MVGYAARPAQVIETIVPIRRQPRCLPVGPGMGLSGLSVKGILLRASAGMPAGGGWRADRPLANRSGI